MQELKHEEFLKLREFIYNKMGINLTEVKKQLLKCRLQKILTKYKLKTFMEYYDFLIKNENDKTIMNELADKISTNFTFFYRESEHFDFFLDTIIPETLQRLEKEKSKDIRFWSAGCSSGAEPYTIVMLMKEYFKAKYSSYDAGILATDLSEEILEEARIAVYSADSISKLPPSVKNKYLKKTPDEEFQVDGTITQEVTFRRFNLMNDVFPFKKKFHAIFCRNVMIYFDGITRDSLVDKFADCLIDGGYLLIGHSESIGKGRKSLEYVKPAIYRKI